MDPALRKRLDHIHDRCLTNDSAVVNALLEAFCDAAEQVDAVRFPFIVLMAERELMFAESGPGKGGASPPGKPPDNSKRHRGDGPRRAVS